MYSFVKKMLKKSKMATLRTLDSQRANGRMQDIWIPRKRYSLLYCRKTKNGKNKIRIKEETVLKEPDLTPRWFPDNVSKQYPLNVSLI